MPFNISEGIFIIAAIILIGGGALYFGSNSQYIGLLIYLPVSVLIFVVYGLRWFGPEGIYKIQTAAWPPALNACPDYLTGYTIPAANPSATKTLGCVDTMGISRNGGITIFKKGDTITASPDPRFFPLNAGESRSALCSRVMTAGLTWEGVTDGETCFSADGSGTGIVPGGGSNNCSTTG